jgi:hypothetical protein
MPRIENIPRGALDGRPKRPGVNPVGFARSYGTSAWTSGACGAVGWARLRAVLGRRRAGRGEIGRGSSAACS